MLANLYHLALRPGIDDHRAGRRAAPLLRLVANARDRQRRVPGVLALRPPLGRRRWGRVQEPPRRQLGPAHPRVGGRDAAADRRRPGDGARRVPAVAGDRGRRLRPRSIGPWRWARRSRECHRGGPTALFGIVQGSVYPRLRQRAIEELEPLDFDGYAIGGVAVGEGTAASRDVVARFAPALPDDKPRYLMGVGTPDDILHAVGRGRRSLRLRPAGAQRAARPALHPRRAAAHPQRRLSRRRPPARPGLRLPRLPAGLPRAGPPPDPLRRDHRAGAGDAPQHPLLP